MAASRLRSLIFVTLLVMQMHYPLNQQSPMLTWSAPTATAAVASTTTTTSTPTSTPTSTTTSTLSFSPPAMTNAYIINNVNVKDVQFPRTGDPSVSTPVGWYFPSTQDVVIFLPTNQVIGQPVIVKGGRNVRIVGGEWNLQAGDVCLVIDSPSKSVFVEGCHLNSGSSGLYPDIIVLRNRPSSQVPGAGPYDIYFQNCLVDYCLYQGTPNANHTDIIQDQSNVPLGNVYIENFTGITSDQGFFFPNRSPMKSIHLRNVDLRYGAAPVASGALLWIRDDNTVPILPGSMENVFLGDNPLISPWYTISLWPKNFNIPGKQFIPNDFGTWGTIPNADGSAVTFKPVDQITGEVRHGPPPGGSFVSAQSVGLNYRSPHDRPAGPATPQTAHPSPKEEKKSLPPRPSVQVPLPQMRLP